MIQYLLLVVIIIYWLWILADLNRLIKEKEELYARYQKGLKIDDDLQQAYKDQIKNYDGYVLALKEELMNKNDHIRCLKLKIKQLEGKLNETI